MVTYLLCILCEFKVNDNPLDYFPQSISNESFRIYHFSEFSPENFTKVTFLCKIGMIYTFSSIFPLIMVLEPISLNHTRSSNPKFSHICDPVPPNEA